MVFFFVKSNENTYPKGRANVQSCPYNEKRELVSREFKHPYILNASMIPYTHSMPSFLSANDFIMQIAKYWLVAGTDSSVILHIQ